MVSGKRQILGLAMTIIGFLGSIVICALPNWKVIRPTGCTIISYVIWEGLWMHCVDYNTGQVRCIVYNSFSTLSQDLQAARALVVIAIIFGISGILLIIIGGKCTSCIKNERQKCQVDIAAGVIFIITGLLVLIPVCRTADTIIRDSYNPVNDYYYYNKLELGVSLYIGWGAAGLLLLGGGLLCPRKKKSNLNETLRFSSLKNECEI